MSRQVLSTCKRRLNIEKERIQKEGLSMGFYAFESPTQDIDTTWDIYIKGSPNSIYENTFLAAKMTFPHGYPIHPPKMRFVTKIYHPNIYPDGRVCISILHVQDDDPTSEEKAEEKWTPVHGICTIVLSVISMLNDPNPNSPANVDASKDMQEDINEYYRKAKDVAIRNTFKWDDVPYDKLLKSDQEILRKLFDQ